MIDATSSYQIGDEPAVRATTAKSTTAASATSSRMVTPASSRMYQVRIIDGWGKAYFASASAASISCWPPGTALANSS